MTALQAKDRRRLGLRSFAATKKTFWLTTMMLPGAVWLLLIRYLPMFGIVIAFKNYRAFRPNTFWNNIVKSEWVGLKNFEFLKSPDTGIMIRNTLGYNLLWILLGLVISVAFAVMMSELTKAAGQKVTNFYHDTTWWPLILTICNLWKNLGYSSVLYLAAITGIDTTQYEAAAVDGATKWQQIWHVTLPGIRPMIVILLIMNVGKIFNADFGLFYNVPQNSGSLYPVTQVVDTYVYRAYANTHNLGMSSAAGFLQSFIGLICIIGANSLVRKIDPDSSLF